MSRSRKVFTIIDGVTASIEPNLSKLESLAADIVHKIVEDESLKNLSDDEKHLFSYFIVAQLIRVKQSRTSLKQMNNTLVDKISEMGFDPNNISGFTPSDATDVKRISAIGLRDSIIKLASYIYDKAWILFRAPNTESYYISDNPVTLQNMNDYDPYGNLGLAVRGIEIYFPLNKKLSLGMLCRSYEKMIQSNYRKINLLKKIGLLKKLRKLLVKMSI